MRGKKIHHLSRLFSIGIILVLFISINSSEVSADSGEDFDIRIEPGNRYFIEFTLLISEAIYVRFHVTYGEGIYFFIVDQDGHDDIIAGRQAETTYEEATYYAEDGQWRYIDFSAPHSDTWYVWFSKASGAPLADSAATIEGHARQDTDGPIVQEFYVLGDTISGSSEVHYKVLDQGYPIASLLLLANSTQILSITDVQSKHYTIGFEASGTQIWDSTSLANGRYSLTLIVSDSLGHVTYSNAIYVTVSNEWFHNPIILALMFCIVFSIVALVIWKRMK